MAKIKIIDKALNVDLHTREGFHFKIGAYRTSIDNEIDEHALIYKGEIVNPASPLLVRINSSCFTGDIFHCSRCDCTWQLNEALRIINEQNGLLIYHFSHEGRGVGFLNKLRTYKLMDQNDLTTHDAFRRAGFPVDQRDFSAACLILEDLGVSSVRLMTNNPDKKHALEKAGIEVVELVPLVNQDKRIQSYLSSKREQFGHIIDFDDVVTVTVR